MHTATAVLEALGATVEEISLPHTEYAIATYYIIAPAEASANLARYDGVRYGYRNENPEDLIDMYKRTRSEAFGEEVKRRIMIGTFALSAGYQDAYYRKAQKVRTLIKSDFDAAFEKVDVIATPTSPTPAFKIGERTDDPLQNVSFRCDDNACEPRRVTRYLCTVRFCEKRVTGWITTPRCAFCREKSVASCLYFRAKHGSPSAEAENRNLRSGFVVNAFVAPFGGLLGAMVGGVLWAKYIQWTGHTAGFIAIGIGVFIGTGMLLTSSRSLERDARTMWLVVSTAAALFAILGIFIGKYLDVQWKRGCPNRGTTASRE